MSQDGRAQVITKDIGRSGRDSDITGICGGTWTASLRDRFQSCSLGHVHCNRCRRVAHRFRKGWTCDCHLVADYRLETEV